jgi:Protein of unknown function (DUF3515)
VACGGGAVEVRTPALSPDVEGTCANLVAALPATVDSASRRDVEPAGAPAAAWGDPAIVLRCGVAMPESFDEFATCQETDGVGWFIPEEQMTGEGESITMTTIDRAVNIEVTLPPEHWPPANAMVDLGPAIKKHVEQTDPCV